MKLKLLTLALLAAITARAQDTVKVDNWKRAFQAGFNFNQAAFSDNWSTGGISSIATTFFLNAKANYSDQKKISWDNEIQLGYGFVQNKGEDLKKSIDRIYLDSKLGYKLAGHWNLYASVNFGSQFTYGYKYDKDVNGAETSVLISDFMSPGYLTGSVGFEYKPRDYFWARFGTGTLRYTFVYNDELFELSGHEPVYGVEYGKHMKSDVAFQVTSSFDRDIMKNTNLKVRGLALAPYDNFGRIVSQLEVLITAKVNRFIDVSLGGLVRNDMDQDPDAQFSQVFGLGIAYSFSEIATK